jgi:hypothetical protein
MKRTIATAGRRASLVFIGLAATLSGCTGNPLDGHSSSDLTTTASSGSSSSATTGSGRTGSTSSSTVTLQGVASRGAMQSGTVQVVAVSPDGTSGLTLGTGTIASDGTFSVSLPSAATGPIRVQVQGGTYTSELDGSAQSTSTSISAVVDDAASLPTVLSVNPLTSFVDAFTSGKAQTGTDFVSAHQSANSAVMGAFGFSAATAESLQPNFSPSATGDSAILLDLLGGLESEAKTDGITDRGSLAAALAQDLSDGVFDGQAGGLPVPFNGGFLPPTAGTTLLTAGVESFAAAQGSALPAAAQTLSQALAASPLNPTPTVTVNAVIFDAVKDFSLAANPNGVWTYGDLGNFTAPSFVPFTQAFADPSGGASMAEKTRFSSGGTNGSNNNSIAGTQAWGNLLPVPNNSEILKNDTGANLTYEGSITQPADELNLSVESSAPSLRFTAPATADYSVTGHFDRIDSSNNSAVSVEILQDQTTVLHSLTNFLTYGQPDPFNIVVHLTAGETLDFAAVADASPLYDSTGLHLVIVENPTTANFTVSATDNVYGAQFADAPNPGQAGVGGGGGTVASYLDFGTLPTSSYVTFPSVVDNSPPPNQSEGSISSPDGYAESAGYSSFVGGYRALSGITFTGPDFQFGLVGVFTNAASTANATVAPAEADFSMAGESAAILSPLLNQVFPIGDGLTGTGNGTLQKFVVPAGATRLTVGFADSAYGSSPPSGYQDNSGSLNTTLVVHPGP